MLRRSQHIVIHLIDMRNSRKIVSAMHTDDNVVVDDERAGV
jgi:hypothetical protein